MPDWADDEAARAIFNWEKRWPGQGYGKIPVSAIAAALRKARAAGLREAADVLELPHHMTTARMNVSAELRERADWLVERSGDA